MISIKRRSARIARRVKYRLWRFSSASSSYPLAQETIHTPHPPSPHPFRRWFMFTCFELWVLVYFNDQDYTPPSPTPSSPTRCRLISNMPHSSREQRLFERIVNTINQRDSGVPLGVGREGGGVVLRRLGWDHCRPAWTHKSPPSDDTAASNPMLRFISLVFRDFLAGLDRCSNIIR